MKTPERPADWLTQARNILDAEIEHLDYATRAQLTATRNRALAQLPLHRTRLRAFMLWTATVTASLLGVVMMLRTSGSLPEMSTVPSVLADDSAWELTDEELLATHDSLELYENLEFYAWLQSQPVGG